MSSEEQEQEPAGDEEEQEQEPAVEEKNLRLAWQKMKQLESVISAWELADDLEKVCDSLEQELKGMGMELPAEENDRGLERAKMLVQVENDLDSGAEGRSTLRTLRRVAVLYSQFIGLS